MAAISGLSGTGGGKSFQIIGLDEINRLFAGLPNAMNKIFQQTSNKHAQIIFNQAYKVVPVRTGFLRSTIGVTTTPQETRFYANAPYAAAVHEGRGTNARIGPRRYLTDPFDQQIDLWMNEIVDGLDTYLRSSGGTS